jgi:hypothetical protein
MINVASPIHRGLTPNVVAMRLKAQGLTGPPAGSAVAVVERLLAVQGQDFRGAQLTIRSRSRGLHSSDVRRALTEDRSLVITWLNRGTLHLVRSEDYWWLHALTAPSLFTGNARRLRQEGVSQGAAERGVQVVEQSLSDEGPLTRAQLRDRIAAAGVRVEGQALTHILMRASLLGIAVRGPVVAGEQSYALVRDWLGTPSPFDREVALAELARRYLVGHGPATEHDLSMWAGLPLRDVRRGLSGIAGEISGCGNGLVDLADRGRSRTFGPPRLLGAFDPLLLGWVSREPIVGNNQSLVTSNGVFRPFALVQGRAVASWALPASQVILKPFQPLDDEVASALALEAEQVRQFLAS